jgi:dTDP-3-amino-3,4,6-trideoxy-alpha-D-glucose transaminase
MFRFAPFKPLGSAGNGAMVVTDDEAIHAKLRLLASYGHNDVAVSTPLPARDVPSHYQDYIAEGYNVPLDGLQAALVLLKLPHLEAWTAKRRAIAAALEAGLASASAITPRFRPESAPTFRSYAIRVAASKRRKVDAQAKLHNSLREAGIEAVVHYAPPIHHYAVYAGGLPGADNLPVTEMLARQYVNLPVTPELTADEVNYMIDTTNDLLKNISQ